MRRIALGLAFLASSAGAAAASSLDVSTEYRLRALSYENLNLNTDLSNDHSFISQSARLGFAIKDIHLTDARGENETLNIVLKLRAIGVEGSTSTLAAAPFDRIAENYPDASFKPFLENAYFEARRLGGKPWDLVVGRQSFRLGTGLLLDDNGAGLNGVTAKGELPFWDMRANTFFLQTQARQIGAPRNVSFFGLTLELPSEGVWQLNQLVEKDRTPETLMVTGCTAAGGTLTGYSAGCEVSQATRWFSSLRYQLHYGPLVFDGEAALQKGAATPTGLDAAQNHITFNGNAEVLRLKWKQTFWRKKDTGKAVEGIARAVFARGSGDNPATPTTDESFFPSNGLRYDGMERTGFGEFFAATPYDAFGGQSTATASGLQRGASGILAAGFGITPPAWKGIVLDVDYFLYQADRNIGYHRTLGSELDVALRYDIQGRFTMRATAAFFKTGPASNVNKNAARRMMFEASAKF
ncbi:MAG: hypothetical protein A2X36_00330 [Elusimicrobia bacterium GWA2_69_24]|nr:MAG: hypothetical protein A2X36_00330 [Elusimicrobia bacterium GWA2_69_24]HBL16757.1 hypothetical protein [Elusimicrobiota bacterium]